MENGLEKEIEVEKINIRSFDPIVEFLSRTTVNARRDRKFLGRLAHNAHMSVVDLRQLTRQRVNEYFKRIERNFTYFPEWHFNDFEINFEPYFLIGAKVNSEGESNEYAQAFIRKDFSVDYTGKTRQFKAICKMNEDGDFNVSFGLGIENKEGDFSASMIYSLFQHGHYRGGRAQTIWKNFAERTELRESSINSARDQMISYILRETEKSL